jgi:hypothetical protein
LIVPLCFCFNALLSDSPTGVDVHAETVNVAPAGALAKAGSDMLPVTLPELVGSA